MEGLDVQLIESLVELGTLRNKKDYYGELLNMFSAQLNSVFNQLSSQYEQFDISLWVDNLHKLKGGAASLGASGLSKEIDKVQSLFCGNENSLPLLKSSLHNLEKYCWSEIQKIRKFYHPISIEQQKPISSYSV